MKQVTFDGTYKSLKPLFPIENAVNSSDFDSYKEIAIFHIPSGKLTAKKGDVIIQDDNGNILSILTTVD